MTASAIRRRAATVLTGATLRTRRRAASDVRSASPVCMAAEGGARVRCPRASPRRARRPPRRRRAAPPSGCPAGAGLRGPQRRAFGRERHRSGCPATSISTSCSCCERARHRSAPRGRARASAVLLQRRRPCGARRRAVRRRRRRPRRRRPSTSSSCSALCAACEQRQRRPSAPA